MTVQELCNMLMAETNQGMGDAIVKLSTMNAFEDVASVDKRYNKETEQYEYILEADEVPFTT